MKKSWLPWFIVAIASFAACGILILIDGGITGGICTIIGMIAVFVGFFASLGCVTTYIDGKRATCKSCKQVMKGAGYEIEFMQEIHKDKSVVAEYEVTVECPFCGEENSFIRKETIAFVDQKGNVRRSNGMAGVEKYCKRLFR